MRSHSHILQMQMQIRRDKHGTHRHADSQLVDSLFFIKCSLENNAFSVLHYVISVALHRFEI